MLVDNILYFLRQDNNRVLGITTAYNLTNMIIKARNRPSFTSTSVFVIRSIFEASARKDLPIPAAINAYNHYMGGMDIANQLQASFTTLRL